MYQRPNFDGVKMALGTVLIVLVFAGAGWASCNAPCSWYRGGAIKNVPARCWAEFVKP